MQAKIVKPDVVVKEHGQVSDHDDASVKNFRGKFPHPFNATVDIADSFGHKGASVITELPVQKGVIEQAPHPAGSMVGKNPHAEAFDRPADLN